MELDDSINSRKPPQTILYSKITPLGLKARSIKYRTTPVTSGTYNAGNNTIRFNISSSTAFLDPHLTYLKFKVTSGEAVIVTLDGSAHSFIKRLRITSKSGGFDLENINEYGNLYNMLSDIQLGTQYRAGAGALCEGFGSTIGANGHATYCIPLMSSIIGQMNNKYLPLFLTGDIQLEIELHARPMTVVVDANPLIWSVDNVELHTQLIEFSSEVNNTLRAIASTSGLYIHSTSWKYFPGMCAVGQSNNLMINERLRSVKTLLFGFRNPGIPADKKLASMGRSANSLSGYQMKIGQNLYPPQAITGEGNVAGNISEFYAETLKAVGCYANSHNHGVITPASFIINTVALSGVVATIGQAVFGIDLDAFTKQNIESGVNTILDNPLNLMLSHSANSEACGCDMYLLHDQILVLQPDGQFLVSR